MIARLTAARRFIREIARGPPCDFTVERPIPAPFRLGFFRRLENPLNGFLTAPRRTSLLFRLGSARRPPASQARRAVIFTHCKRANVHSCSHSNALHGSGEARIEIFWGRVHVRIAMMVVGRRGTITQRFRKEDVRMRETEERRSAPCHTQHSSPTAAASWHEGKPRKRLCSHSSTARSGKSFGVRREEGDATCLR